MYTRTYWSNIFSEHWPKNESSVRNNKYMDGVRTSLTLVSSRSHDRSIDRERERETWVYVRLNYFAVCQFFPNLVKKQPTSSMQITSTLASPDIFFYDQRLGTIDRTIGILGTYSSTIWMDGQEGGDYYFAAKFCGACERRERERDIFIL